MFIYDNGFFNSHRYIINFPTKKHWRHKSDIKFIEQGLKDLVKQIKKNKIKSICVPPLGCGLGGLNWLDVKLLINEYLSDINSEIFVFEPIY